MSAWIVSKGHIDVLTNGLVQHGIITSAEMAAVGQDLWRENHRSIRYRYGRAPKTPRYSPRTTEAEISDQHLAAAVHCYDYQTCEHDSWPKSRAYRLMQALLEILEDERGVAYDKGRFGVDYLWGYDRLEQATVKGVPVP